MLADYIAGKADFNRLLTTAGTRRSSQLQRVSGDQVGSVEQELPDIIDIKIVPETPGEFGARPPIVRSDAESEMKVLTVSDPQPMLNNFQMFLALSDRLAKTEGDFSIGLTQPRSFGDPTGSFTFSPMKQGTLASTMILS